MKKFYLLAVGMLICLSGIAAFDAPRNLKVDNNATPLGIDNSNPGFTWEVGDRNRGAVQSAYRIVVSSAPEMAAKQAGDIWDSGKVRSNQTIQIPYGGRPLESSRRYYWSVQTWDGADHPSGFSEIAWFETGLLNQTDWEGQWISSGKQPPAHEEAFYENIPAPLFRKSFRADEQVARARLYISGLGYYEAYLNGRRVGDHRLDPGWTQYAKTVYYAAYDVTGHLAGGENVIGVMLGNGWYNPLPMQLFGRFNLREVLTIGQPKVIAQLRIEYVDGSAATIATDASWKTADGPVIRNNVYLGEWYDARMEKEGWDRPGYNDRGWDEASLADAPGGQLKWQFIPPIRSTRVVKPVSMHDLPDGRYVMDMGQNFAGVIRFRAEAPAGTEIIFRYAELLNNDGTLDFNTTAAAQIKAGRLQGGPGAPATAWQEDRYYCNGNSVEVFQPRFTFHGFRYVEISGMPYPPGLNDLEGLRLNSDLPDAASFQCSNQLFNKIQEATEWTMLSNVFSIESDCPAREKFGYGGDIVTAGEAFLYNFDMANFYTKTARDFARDARPNGGMTECAPDIGINERGVTDDTGPVGWTLAHPFVLKKLYQYYGNLSLVKEQYEPLKKLVDFYREHAPDHLIMDGIGDHNSVDERPRPVSSTAFYYHHARILSELAGVLGRTEDHQEYATLAENIKQAFIRKFVNLQTGEVYTRTQADQVFALYYDLLPAGLQDKAQRILMEEIFLKHHGHLSTGIFSTKMMLEYLHDQELDEVAYTMMNQKEFPGYGYMIDNGATTLWENWNFEKHDSKNHPMFGSVSEWFHRALLGIGQSDRSVAFSEIVIKPAVVGGLNWAGGYYHSVRGKIASHWWKFGDDLFLEVEIPANAKALVYLPVNSKQKPTIKEGKVLLVKNGEVQTQDDDPIRFLRSNLDYYLFEVGAGRYAFEVR